MALVVAAAVAAAAAGLDEARFVFEHAYDVYVTDGRGAATKVLAKVETRGGAEHERLFDAFFQPSLSPDGRRIACVRFRNYSSACFNCPRLVPIQSSEIVVAGVGGEALTVAYAQPDGVFDRLPVGVLKRELASPIWSADGERVLFLEGNRLRAFRVGETRVEEIVRLPVEARAALVRDWLTSEYIRLSAEGGSVFALVGGRAGPSTIWRITLDAPDPAQLWSGRLVPSGGNRIAVPAPLDDEAAKALFGSRQFPVMAPRFSADRRYYTFVKVKFGILPRLWVGGYDTAEQREFTVKTLQRGLYWE